MGRLDAALAHARLRRWHRRYPGWCLTFLAALRQRGNLSEAAEQAGTTAGGVRRYRATYPDFDAECHRALMEYHRQRADQLESMVQAELRQRGK